MPPVIRLLLPAFLTFACAAPASAATFYVDDNGPLPVTAGCQDAGHPCATINAALTASRNVAGTGDTISVAGGTYDEDLVIDQPTDNGLTVSGTGTLLNPAKIQHVSATAASVRLGASSAPLNTGITMSGITVVVPVGSSSSKAGVVVYAVNSKLQDVSVSMADQASQAIGLEFLVASGTNTLDHVVVVSKADAVGVGLLPGATTMATRLGVAMTGSGANDVGVFAIGATAHLNGAIIKLPANSAADGIAVTGSGADVTVDSSLIEGGKIGVFLDQSGAGMVTAMVRRSTVDAATPGVDDGGLTGNSVFAGTDSSAGAVATLTAVDSLLVDTPGGRAQGGLGTPHVACTNSIVPPNPAQPSVACGAAEGNSTADPSVLFLDAPGYDYRPKPGSPAIDAGSPSLAAGEPSRDFAAQPRDVDGNQDCVARPDLGAYELQGQANTPPTAAADGPATAAPGDVLSFSVTGTDAEDAPAALTLTWAFSDGATASGAAVQHAFAASGSQTATVTVTDSHGCTATSVVSVAVAPGNAVGGHGGGGVPSPGADTVPPVLTAVSLKPSGLRLRFTLSEPARVTATLQRRVCRRVKGHARCRLRAVGRVRLQGAAGANTRRLKFGRQRPTRGTYRLTLVARDPAGNASLARGLAFHAP